MELERWWHVAVQQMGKQRQQEAGRRKPGGRGECLARVHLVAEAARSLSPSWLKEPREPAREPEAARYARTADRPKAETTGCKAAWRGL